MKVDLYSLLECHDPSKYRKKIKGFHRAFNIEKGYRIPLDEKPKLKYKSKLNGEEIKRTMDEIRIKKMQEVVLSERHVKEKYD
jgi:hypothetical protein